LEANGIIASCRKDRSGSEFLRFSPHFYNTEAELDRALEALAEGMRVTAT
jgi:selenocysteine lyase/cysteine desulfurase